MLLKIQVPVILFSDLSNPLSFISRLIDWICVIISSFCSQAKALTLEKRDVNIWKITLEVSVL